MSVYSCPSKRTRTSPRVASSSTFLQFAGILTTRPLASSTCSAVTRNPWLPSWRVAVLPSERYRAGGKRPAIRPTTSRPLTLPETSARGTSMPASAIPRMTKTQTAPAMIQGFFFINIARLEVESRTTFISFGVCVVSMLAPVLPVESCEGLRVAERPQAQRRRRLARWLRGRTQQSSQRDSRSRSLHRMGGLGGFGNRVMVWESALFPSRHIPFPSPPP